MEVTGAPKSKPPKSEVLEVVEADVARVPCEVGLFESSSKLSKFNKSEYLLFGPSSLFDGALSCRALLLLLAAAEEELEEEEEEEEKELLLLLLLLLLLPRLVLVLGPLTFEAAAAEDVFRWDCRVDELVVAAAEDCLEAATAELELAERAAPSSGVRSRAILATNLPS